MPKSTQQAVAVLANTYDVSRNEAFNQILSLGLWRIHSKKPLPTLDSVLRKRSQDRIRKYKNRELTHVEFKSSWLQRFPDQLWNALHERAKAEGSSLNLLIACLVAFELGIAIGSKEDRQT